MKIITTKDFITLEYSPETLKKFAKVGIPIIVGVTFFALIAFNLQSINSYIAALIHKKEPQQSQSVNKTPPTQLNEYGLANVPDGSPSVIPTENPQKPGKQPVRSGNSFVYTNTYPKYSLIYPDTWTIDASQAEYTAPDTDYHSSINILRKDHMLIVDVMGAGFGPSVCAYPDKPLTDKEKDEINSFIEFTDYVEIRAKDGTIYRRSNTPRLHEGRNIWDFCTFDGSGFGTLYGPMYSTPINYDPAIIREMDQIVNDGLDLSDYYKMLFSSNN